MYHRILELYSGIGGMHCAWNESGLQGEIVAAVDINTVANEVYRYNFPETKLLTRNIETLKFNELMKLNVDTILMSPPCQPFTRNGKYLDENDPRTKSFIAILEMLKQLKCIEYILMENVKGFECSSVRNIFIESLKACGFQYQEFLLCPTSVGVPNSRLRYFCLARRNSSLWDFKKCDAIITKLEQDYEQPYTLETILDPAATDDFLVSDKFLKRVNLMDICHKGCSRSCCFTKAYSHYIEGTGSVFTPKTVDDIQYCLKEANNFEPGSKEFLENLKPLKLRFFTPKEVLSLMSFPEKYRFPKHTTRKQCYRLIGNSVNVKVISELLKLLYL